jgi:hypothetical protein
MGISWTENKREEGKDPDNLREALLLVLFGTIAYKLSNNCLSKHRMFG